MTSAVQTRDNDSLMVSEREMHALSVREITDQVKLIQTVMRDVMKEGEHYGTIPGCGDKPALLKPGAEKLGMTFRLAPRFDVRRTDYPNGHREYEITCTLNDRHQGVGACSTLEAKYRYRTGPKKFTGKPVPKDYWNLRGSNPAKASEMLGGKGFAVGKNDAGAWEICEAGEKVEHDNPADHWNTVLKMAKKRAHVDAILTATAASDIFAQDIDEFADNGVTVGNPPAAQSTPPATNDQASAPPVKAHPIFPTSADPENDGYEPAPRVRRSSPGRTLASRRRMAIVPDAIRQKRRCPIGRFGQEIPLRVVGQLHGGNRIQRQTEETREYRARHGVAKHAGPMRAAL